MAKPGYKHLGEVPEEVFQEELFKYLERREANPDAKKVPAQFEYNNKKYYFERSPTESGFRVRRSADFVAKEQRRRKSLSKPKLSSIEKMMVKNIYEEASQRGLHVDHVDPAKIGGMHHPYNLKLMQPTENIRKGSKIGGDYRYEPLLEQSKGAVRVSKPAVPAAPPVQAKRKPTKPAKPSRKAIAFKGGSVSFSSATPGLVPTPGVGTRMGGGYEVQDPGGMMLPIMLP